MNQLHCIEIICKVNLSLMTIHKIWKIELETVSFCCTVHNLSGILSVVVEPVA